MMPTKTSIMDLMLPNEALKMIKMVKFMLCAFYHNFINKYMNKNSSV